MCLSAGEDNRAPAKCKAAPATSPAAKQNLLCHLNSLSPAMPSRGSQTDGRQGTDKGMGRRQAGRQPGKLKLSPALANEMN